MIWWVFKFLIWFYYQFFLLCKRFVLWVIGLIKNAINKNDKNENSVEDVYFDEMVGKESDESL